ncbi:MAG: magnesium transporter [Spirochaetales bacterium]|nr:magnesium transporter [Spirochaetales bacterium]MBO6048579.1 magnesium transporter [Spirochaetales bacterium]MBP5756820.1 magnesium transporter [Spirochaetales bacterium]
MAQHNVSVEETLKVLVENKKYSTVKDILVTMNPSDIASIFDELAEDQIPIMFRLLPKALAADTFVEMDPDNQELLIKGFSDTELKQVLDELYVDDAADIVEEMPANVVSRILMHVTPDRRREINEILQFPENSAGSIMTTEFISLSPNMTVSQAFQRIRDTGVDKETIYTCYVLSRFNRILGLVSAKDLMLAKDQQVAVETLMTTNVITVSTMMDQEEVAKQMSKYNFMALPVVDRDNRMVGIITFDDAMDVMEEEATEDITIMSAQTPYEKSYIRTSPWELFKHRIPWLMLLMISATFTGLIITSFEKALSQLVILTAFIPMLMDTGGNSGSQSSVTVIRAISLGELDFKDLGKVLLKEFTTALMCGLALGIVCFGKVILVDGMIFGNMAEAVTYSFPLVAVVVSVTMSLTVVLAKMIGCTLPLVAKKLGFDPAVMASPFITTIVDALSLLVYLKIATTVLF